MNWTHFPYVLAVAAACWLAAALPRPARPAAWTAAGVLAIALFIAGLTVTLGRPPLRTLGETRLGFGVLLPLAGLLVHRAVPWRWPLVVANGLGFAFLLVTALRPETHDRTLPPALQSPWFVPHVVLYLLAYAFLVHAAGTAAVGLARGRGDDDRLFRVRKISEVSLWLGFGFLTLGLLAGAVWAKEAWGHWWTWDPKETWAFLTWATYLAYFHLHGEWTRRPGRALVFLVAASAVVLACWFGVNALPSAAQSVHTYAS